MKCPHCGIDAAAHGAEVLKCWECGRWIKVTLDSRGAVPRYVGVKYFRTKKNFRGDISNRPTSVELLVERCRSLGYNVTFRRWKFEKLRPGHWQRSAGAWAWLLTWELPNGGTAGCGSQFSVAQILKDGDRADIQPY